MEPNHLIQNQSQYPDSSGALLIILVLIACFATAGTISDLNNRLLDAQTDYAVASVDDFFRGKIAVAGTFEENSTLQNYFEAVSSPQDIPPMIIWMPC